MLFRSHDLNNDLLNVVLVHEPSMFKYPFVHQHLEKIMNNGIKPIENYLSVFVEIATTPSGHCSLEKPAAYSRVS